MDSWFLDDLYNSTIVDVLNIYGPFVITGYYSGGRVDAFYYGKYAVRADSTTMEKDLTFSIDASYKWGTHGKDSANSSSANFHFGNNKGSGLSEENKFSEVISVIGTTGGSKDLLVRTPPTDISKLNIDLSSWLSSLNNKSTHAFIGLQDGGLLSISNFMLEENFRRRVQDTHLGYFNTNALIEPFIEILKVLSKTTSSGEKLYDIAAVLNTRQGDKIILSKGNTANITDVELRANNTSTVFNSKSQILANEKKAFYQCLIKANSKTTISSFIHVPLSINLTNINENRMMKFYNEESDM